MNAPVASKQRVALHTQLPMSLAADDFPGINILTTRQRSRLNLHLSIENMAPHSNGITSAIHRHIDAYWLHVASLHTQHSSVQISQKYLPRSRPYADPNTLCKVAKPLPGAHAELPICPSKHLVHPCPEPKATSLAHHKYTIR